MSYARFGWNGSDVYVFTSRAGIECCGCRMQDAEWVDDPGIKFLGGYLKAIPPIIETVFRSNEAMIDHLMQHRERGHHVPEDALERLRDPEDAAENRRIWAEADPG